MTNLCVLLGTGYAGEDILHKLPWIRFLKDDHQLYVSSRIGEKSY